MKKISSILAIATIICLCSFIKKPPISSFQYELRNIVLEGNFVDSGNGNGSQKISVVVGIVGEPYGFVKTNTFDVGLETSKSIDENKKILRQNALEFINENYPDK